MKALYCLPEKKRLRVIVDTDAACEADDPFAIAHALMSRKFDVKAILAEQFGGPDTTEKSYQEIETILEAMDLSVPVLMGEKGCLREVGENALSPAARFVIEEAKKESTMPLFILCLGAITNIASAIRKCPEIASKMTVVWIGGQNPDCFYKDHREFNAGNDIEAVNLVVGSGVEFWQIPNNVYGTMRIGLAEIENRIYPCGKIGKHLYENMLQYNMTDAADWTAGESWSLGDSPAIGVALDPACGQYEYREAPIFNEDTTYRFETTNRRIRVYQSIDSRYILEDFIAKLHLFYGSGN